MSSIPMQAVAAHLKLKERTACLSASEDLLHDVKVGESWVLRRNEIEKWIKRKEQQRTW